MQLFIPKNIEFVLKTLKNAGYDAFIVGGCVRDMLSSKSPHDFDITSSATPNEIKALFDKTADTGIQHGTVTVIIDKTPIEVTTFRTEDSYTDSRHPDSVRFVTDIKYDLSRRDFTVNAMAYNSTDGLIDLFGGKNDLENRILRAVGNPEKRFSEDALRILRLYRFSSVLDFSIEKNTLIAAKKCAVFLKNVSSERILNELSKAVCGKNTAILSELIDSNALDFLGVKGLADTQKLSHLKSKASLRLFAFLEIYGCDALRVLKQLKASNAIIKYCEHLMLLTKNPMPYSKAEIKRAINATSPEEFYDYLDFLKNIKGESTDNTVFLANEIIKAKEPYKTEHLSINGNDLKSIGYSGKDISAGLRSALDLVIENPQKNQKEILLQYLSN